MLRSVRKLALLFHTVRHMRIDQIAWQVRYRMGSWNAAATPVRRNTPPKLRLRRDLIAPPHKFSILSEGPTFTMLGESSNFERRIEWQVSNQNLLWRYNLHYFDYIDEIASTSHAGDVVDFLHRWIKENPIGQGVGWDPYPTSLRIVNWIRWMWRSNCADERILDSLRMQADWLSNRLERHILANHLFTNGKALLCAGLFFESGEGDADQTWLELGLQVVSAELEEQILDDGGHYELSPLYHGVLLDDVLDLIDMGSAAKVIDQMTLNAWRDTAVRMLEWSGVMTHPDGEIPFFNDSAFGIAAPPACRLKRGLKLGLAMAHNSSERVGSRHLVPSGYVRLSVGRAVLFADVGYVGPRYQPGHTHADTLSFELSLGLQRVFVNSGTSTYEPGAERKQVRSTSAHNTVEIDGADSSEVWASFRVGRRARPIGVEVDLEAGRLVAGHDGYQRLPGRVTHQRSWHLLPDRLCVADRLMGRWSTATIRYHLHPHLSVLPSGQIMAGKQQIATFSVSGGDIELTDTLWYPRFGERQPNRCIVVHCRSDLVRLDLFFDPQ